MEFGIFHSGHVPVGTDEHERLLDEVTIAETADRSGFKYGWFTEHHFLREYSHISSNEVFMGYVAARTERIHLGSGIFNITAPVNHPVRVAERNLGWPVVHDGERHEPGVVQVVARMPSDLDGHDGTSSRGTSSSWIGCQSYGFSQGTSSGSSGTSTSPSQMTSNMGVSLSGMGPPSVGIADCPIIAAVRLSAG